MKPTALMTAATVAGIFAVEAWSADYQVKRSLQLPASSTQVWHVIGDFCDIDDWHPGITACDLKVIDGKLHRVLGTADGAEIVEQRIAVEPGLSYTYKVASWPLPIDRYTARFSVEPNEGARVSWSARFASEDPAMEAAITEMIETGLAAIDRYFADD